MDETPTLSPATSRRALLRAAGLASLAAGAPALARSGLERTARDLHDLRPLRRDDGSATQLSPRGLPATPPAAVVALNRMGYGPRPGDVPAFTALGGTPGARLNAYVAQQIVPGAIPDPELNARIAAAGFASVGLSADPDTYLATLWDWYINDNAPGGNSSSSIPRDELVRATFMRAMYSKRQLFEVLVEFWHDHFNVNINHSSFVRATFPHLDLILRQNALGNFRTMLEAVAKSTAMLYYLDQYTSSRSGPNENYCRELIELHTMGTENYVGLLQQNQVPVVDGKPIGYVDADVFEATRAFTGWSFSYGVEGDGDTGLFYYRNDWHDLGQKTVLGTFMPANQAPLQDGLMVLDALASHPGTGRHIARKLCRRLISDNPPQSVVDAAAAVFTAQWQAPDQIRQVVATILLAPEFLSTWGEKVKRPFEITVSALRAGGADLTLKRNDSPSDYFFWRYDDTGHDLFTWPAPDGFPDEKDAWNSMTPRVMSWRMCSWLTDFTSGSGVHVLDFVSQTPVGIRSPNELADFWINRILGRPMSTADRLQVVQLMAQGTNPDFDLNLGDEDIADRLRSMIGVIFMSPDFLYR